MSEAKHTAPACKRIPQLTTEEIALFYSKINRTPTDKGCHLWSAGLNHSGYAVFYIKGERFRASRIQWMLTHGEDPFPWLIRHTCDVEACVRGEHVVRGSDQDNMADAVERKTMASGERNGASTRPDRRVIGEDQKAAKLTDETALAARVRYVDGESARSIALSLGVTGTIIQRLVRGEIWKHIGGPLLEDDSRHWRNRITPEITLKVQSELMAGIPAKQVAINCGVSWPSVYVIRRKMKR